MTVHFDELLFTALDDAAKAADTSKSAFVRNAVREKIARDVHNVEYFPTTGALRKRVVATVGGSNGETNVFVDANDGLSPVQRLLRQRENSRQASGK